MKEHNSSPLNTERKKNKAEKYSPQDRMCEIRKFRKIMYYTKHRRLFKMKNKNCTCPLCDSLPGRQPKPPSKFIQLRTNSTALSTFMAS